MFARISPCTEKGNINQASGLNGEPGYGSTEFLVFRAKPGVSQQDFVLYFSKWNEIKDYAANNLQGTSGRQRVAKEAFDELEVIVPEPDEQRTIASVLGSLDAKIDLLQRQNKTLEAMAETLFRQWFVEEAEEGWISGP
ncbi:MAG: restriction endonuclease subunit S [Flavobacteriales bacterium]|nr:restriction endonuclease subunit S [Flavobacteriales bacterium]